MIQPTRLCPVCGIAIERVPGQLGPHRTYCTDECKSSALAERKRRPVPLPVLTACQGCGVDLPPRLPGQRGSIRKWCSKNCQQQTTRPPKPKRRGQCVQCGVEFEARTRTKRFCSKWCSDVTYGKRRAAPLDERECALDGCSVVFRPLFARQKCCCENHGQIHYNRQSRADGRQKREWDDKRRDAWHRRRALIKGSETGEPVILAYIAERDKWKCHICRKRVSPERKWPHPLSPSLDHLVPVSKGGIHDPSNVRLAHSRCNIAKNDRGSGEQLMLIG